jgi:hypothetical protein
MVDMDKVKKIISQNKRAILILNMIVDGRDVEAIKARVPMADRQLIRYYMRAVTKE